MKQQPLQQNKNENKKLATDFPTLFLQTVEIANS